MVYPLACDAPSWATEAVETYFACAVDGLRITRFHLTSKQADELRAYTGQADTLLGLPVSRR